MFYITEIEDYIRVEPKLFGLPTSEAVEKQLRETYKEYFSKEFGKAIAILSVTSVGEGIIIPGDGAAYYKSTFKLLVWKPEMQELVYGTISEIAAFGAFINMGVMQGMIHISQTMEDFVSYSKSGTLIGKTNKRSLKKGDLCLARIVAVSYKGSDPKIGLTMRQPGLGCLDWIKADKKKSQKVEKAPKAEGKKKTTKKKE